MGPPRWRCTWLATRGSSRGASLYPARRSAGGCTCPRRTAVRRDDWWVYVPAQYDPATPAALLVAQDANLSGAEGWPNPYPDGPSVPPTSGAITLDNLIHKGDIPVTIAIFIKPGTDPGYALHRSKEYDTISNTYAAFLEQEILPLVMARYNITSDPALRVATGGSSGGLAAFCLAFFRPDLFGKVLCWVGSFTNIRGGHHVSWLVRNTPRRPITVFLADGENDVNNQHGSWPLSNLQLHSALEYAGYACRLEMGEGRHGNRHISSLLPDALRWVFRTPAAKPKPPSASSSDAAKL